MDADVRFGTLDGPVHEAWECPRCGARIGHGSPHASFTPPTCRWAHEPVEMEQILPDRFGFSRKEER